MKSYVLACTMALGALTGCVDEAVSASDAPRQIWLNGDIYTVNSKQPWAEAMVVEQGEILYIGEETQAKTYVNANTQIHNLEGHMVLPGLHDVHLHPMEASSDEVSCILDSQNTVNQWVQEIKTCAQQNPNEEWLLGWGHSILTLLESSVEPVKLLDDLVQDRPVAIMEETSHSVWVNSIALQRLSLDGVIEAQTIQGGAVLLNDQKRSIGVLLDGAGDLAFDIALK